MATGGMYMYYVQYVSILKTFACKAIQLQVIILSPEMRQNSPTAISDFKIFSREKPPDSVKRGKRGLGRGVGKGRC